MSDRVTLVLALALVAAGLLVWFDLQPLRVVRSDPTPRPVDETVDASTPLLEFAPEAVEAILLRHGPLELSTRRENEGWSGVSHPERVDDFLVTLRAMVEIMAVQASADDLSDFGLEPPVGSIDLELRDAPPIRLLVGSLSPAGTAIYVRIGNTDRVVLTGALLRWELNKLSRALTEPGRRASPSREERR